MSDAASPLPVLLAPLRTEWAAARIGAGRSAKVVRIGMGPSRAEVARARLARTLAPRAPVGVAGFAGGLATTDRAGDVIVATELRTAGDDRPRVSLDPALADRLAAKLRAGMPNARVRVGPVLCTPTLTSAAERRELPDGESIAVEMESAWLLPLGGERPFAVVRVIVDLPGRELISPFTISGGVTAFRRLVPAARVLASVLAEAAAPIAQTVDS